MIATSQAADRAAPAVESADALAQDLDAAFEGAFAAHWARVCATLYRLVGDWDEAEDLALEVFLKLRRRPPPELEQLGGWLYRVATRVGLNALRARRRRERYEGEAGRLDLQRQEGDDPEIAAIRREAQALVRAVLAELRPRSARLLILRHSGLSYREIAEAMALSPGSVGQALVRAEREFTRRYAAMEAKRGLR